MKILFSMIIATMLLTIASMAQEPDQVGIDSPTVIVEPLEVREPIVRVYPKREAPLPRERKEPDTTLFLLHADHTTLRTSGGVEYITYDGNVQARILDYYIVADRIEVISNPMQVVAEGNAAVMSKDMAEFVKRFEWRKSAPDTPVIEIRRPAGNSR